MAFGNNNRNRQNEFFNGYYQDQQFNGSYSDNGYNGGYTDLRNGSSAYDSYGNMRSTSSSYSSLSLADFSRKVFMWLFIGLGITFFVGFMILANKETALQLLAQHAGAFMIVALVEVVLVFILGFFVRKMPPAACLVVFLVYSLVNGITIAPSLIYFGAESAFYAFAITAGIFGAMAAYGFFTKRDLSSLGVVLLFGLIGLIIFSAVGFFIRIPMSDLITSIIGIVLFIGFTAYDTQKIKKYYASFQSDGDMLARGAIIVALDLYLDFINLFLYILQLLGRNRR